MILQKKLRVGVTSKSFNQNSILMEKLQAHFSDIIPFPKSGFRTKEDLKLFLKDCDAAIVGLEPIDYEILQNCPALKYISKYGVGLNNIDIDYCKKINIEVGWSNGINKLSVAEMTLGFMLALSRNLFFSSYQLKNGEWNKNGGFQLSGKTIGIIGCGNVGKEVIRLLKPFKCRILVNDLLDQKEFYEQEKIYNASKEEIYDQADIISLHIPLDSSSQDLFNYNVFKKCKRKPFLINTARGGIINEEMLLTALNDGLVSGAAIDSFINEPLTEKKIYSHPKIITTPHIGGNSQEAILAMGTAAIKNLIRITAS
jgi:D-3-phosphoglycerate dehydrogenase